MNRCESQNWGIRYAYEFETPDDFPSVNSLPILKWTPPEPYGPAWLRNILGIGFFNEIYQLRVSLNSPADHALFTRIGSQPSITFLKIHGHFDQHDLKILKTLPNLKSLHINFVELTPDQIRSMQHEHPECSIYIRQMTRPDQDREW